MIGLDALRAALDPPADPDPLAQLADVAKTFVTKRPTPSPGDKPRLSDDKLLTKIDEDLDEQVTEAMLGAGAQRVGKRLVLKLGAGRRVVYMPHAEHVGAGERGLLACRMPQAREVAKSLDLLPERAAADAGDDDDGS